MGLEIRLYPPEDEEDVQNFIQEIEERGIDEPIKMQNHTDFHLRDAELYFNGLASNEVFLSASIDWNGSDKHRNLAKKIAELTGIHREYKADDRGRISLGSQYSGETVKVAVIDVVNNE